MFTGVVLAGGASKRMGADKAGLRLNDGRTLLQCACDLLREAGASQLLISGERAGGIADRRPGIGPLGGIDAVLDGVTSDHLLVIPIDMPALPAQLLQRLVAGADRQTSRCFAGFALPALLSLRKLRQGALQHILDRSAARQRSIHALLDALACERLPISDANAARLTNLNTRRDWRAYQDQDHGT